MPTTPRALGCLASIMVALALTSGCEKDGLDERDVRAVCMNLGAGGWREALSVAQQAGIRDESRAAAAVRKAMQDTCPAYADKVEG